MLQILFLQTDMTTIFILLYWFYVIGTCEPQSGGKTGWTNFST